MIAPMSRKGRRRPFGGRPRVSVTNDRPVAAATAVEDTGTMGVDIHMAKGIDGASWADITLNADGIVWAWTVEGYVDGEATVLTARYPRSVGIQIAGTSDTRALATALRYAADQIEQRIGVAPRIDREGNN